jgi:hypothetical protein
MYLIPYFKKEETTFSGNKLLKIVLFLANGGTACLEDVKDSEVKSFCSENGFVIQNQFKTPNGNFVEVDPQKTDISSYYSFSEAHKTKDECWRTFIMVFSEENKDIWNVNSLFSDTPFSKILHDIATV